MQGERVLAQFEQIEIAGDMKKLSARLEQKANLLKQAANIFLDCVSMGVAEWSTAALYQIGHTYEAFAKSLRNAPPPSNLSDADKEAYQSQIDTLRRSHRGKEPRGVRERLEEGGRARHLQQLDGEDARSAGPAQRRALSAGQGDRDRHSIVRTGRAASAHTGTEASGGAGEGRRRPAAGDTGQRGQEVEIGAHPRRFRVLPGRLRRRPRKSPSRRSRPTW